MATWQDVGIDCYQAARDLYLEKPGEPPYYRSSVSRLYYAAFCLVTHELLKAKVGFGVGQDTPSHKGLPKLKKLHLTQSVSKKVELVTIIRRLYTWRIAAGYQMLTTDAIVARDALRDASAVFRYLGVDHG